MFCADYDAAIVDHRITGAARPFSHYTGSADRRRRDRVGDLDSMTNRACFPPTPPSSSSRRKFAASNNDPEGGR
jgi:hypothetical protein